MILLVPAGLTLLMLIGLVGLHVLVGRLGVGSEACPHCAHEVRGLADPRCPECGQRLENGVVRQGDLRPRTRNRLAVLAIVLGGVLGGLLLHAVDRRSYDIWSMTGLADERIDMVRETVTGQPPQPQLLVRTDVDFRLSEHAESTGEVEVVLREGDRDLAAWRGVGPVLIEDGASPRIGIDAVTAIEELRASLPVDADARMAAILHDDANTAALAAAIASYAIYEGTVSGRVVDAGGRKIFDGSIQTTTSGVVTTEPPSALWHAVWWSLPVGIFLLYLGLVFSLLRQRWRLQPFEPHAQPA